MSLNSMLKEINSIKTFDDLLPTLIEVFVSFYGEQKRDQIEEKFKNMLVVSYMNPDDKLFKIKAIYKKISIELLKEFFKENNIESTEEAFNLYFDTLKSSDFSYSTTFPLEKYYSFRNNIDKYKNSIFFVNDVVKFLKKFDSSVNNDNLIEYINNNRFSKIDAMYQSYIEKIEKFKEKTKLFESLEKKIEKTKEIKREIEKEKFKELCNKFSYLFTEEELTNFFNSGYSPKIKAYLGITTTSLSDIYAFSEDSTQELAKDTYKIRRIISDRCSFFKSVYGLNLETFEEQEKYKDKYPSFHLVDEIQKSKDEMKIKILNEYYLRTATYQEIRQRINELNFLNKDDFFEPQLFELKFTCMAPNVRLIDDKIKISPIMYINLGFGETNEYLDKNIIHELNHVYELSLSSYDEVVEYSCGWETLQDEVKNDVVTNSNFEVKTDKREYELFNEIINELIAQKITENMHNQGIYLFNEATESKIKG